MSTVYKKYFENNLDRQQTLGLFFRADAVSFKNNPMGPFCKYKRKMKNSLDAASSQRQV